MKKVKSIYLLLLMIGCSITIFAQTFNGNVYSVLNVGSYDYAYIFVDVEGVYYKTAAYPTGLLQNNTSVEIAQNSEISGPYHYYVTSENNTLIGTYATKLVTDNFSMPLNSTYGMPVLENEILFFSNQEHYDEFYSILTEFSNSAFEERWDLLKLFEDQYPSFISFNKKLDTEYDWWNGEFDEKEIMDLKQIDYFKDMVLKSLVNSHSEIGIGNKVYFLVKDITRENCYSFYINKTELSTIDSIRDEDLIECNPFILDLKFPLLNAIKNGKTDGIIGIPFTDSIKSFTFISITNTTNLSYTASLNTDNVNCESKKATATWSMVRAVTGQGSNINQINQNNFTGSVTFDWGDGSSEIVTIGTLGNNGTAQIVRSHDYATFGTYTVTTTATGTMEDANSQPYNLLDDKDYSTSSDPCTEASYSTSEWMILSSTLKGFNEGWIHNWYVAHTVGASTESWEWNSNKSKWKKQKSNIGAEIDAKFRDNNCTVQEPKFESDYGFQKHIQAVKAKWWTKWDIGNGDCHSLHYLERTSTISSTQIFNPCQ